MSVCRRVSSSVLDPENTGIFAEFKVTPVSVTFAERMLTFVGGVSVIVRTTGAVPGGGVPPTPMPRPPQPASAAQESSNTIVQLSGFRNMWSPMPGLLNSHPHVDERASPRHIMPYILGKLKLAQSASQRTRNNLPVEQKVYVQRGSAPGPCATYVTKNSRGVPDGRDAATTVLRSCAYRA